LGLKSPLIHCIEHKEIDNCN